MILEQLHFRSHKNESKKFKKIECHSKLIQNITDLKSVFGTTNKNPNRSQAHQKFCAKLMSSDYYVTKL